jgi:uncharacterized protein involved in exopolysaccharide biosynthesis
MAKQATTKRTARDVLRMILSRWWWFLGAMTVFAMTVIIYTHHLPLEYTARAEFTRRSEMPTGRNVAPSGREAEEAQRLVLTKELLGWQAVEKVLDELDPELGLTQGMPRNAQGELTDEGKWRKRRLVERMSAQLKGGLSWEVRDRQVDVISLQLTHESREAAYRVPNLLIENYLQRAENQRIDQLKKTRDYFRTQVRDCEDRLKNLQKLTVDFEAKYPHVLPENRQAIHERVRALDAQLEMLEPEQEAKASAVRDLKSLLASLGGARTRSELGDDDEGAAPGAPPAAGEAPGEAPAPAEAPPPVEPPAPPEAPEVAEAAESGPAPIPPPPEEGSGAGEPAEGDAPSRRFIRVKNEHHERIRALLTDYRSRLDDARTLRGMTEKHPTVVALKQRIADLEKRLEAEPRYVELEVVGETDPNLTFRDEMQRVQLLQQIRSAESDLRAVTGQIMRLRAQRESQQQLLDEFRVLRQQYNEYVQTQEKRQRVRVELRDLEEGLREVERSLAAGTLAPGEETEKRSDRFIAAVEPHRPSSPDFAKMMGVALLGGCAFGLGLVWLQDTKDRRIATTQEASRHFELPVVGVIGEITTPVRAAGRWLRRWGLGWGFTLGVVALLGLGAYSLYVWLHAHEKWDDTLPGAVVKQAEGVYETIKGEALERVPGPEARG